MVPIDNTYDFIDPRDAMKNMEKYTEAALPKLINIFCDRYARDTGDVQISEIRLDSYSYLFDHIHQRLVAAYGNVSGKSHAKRDNARQQGHPGQKGSGDDKGHAIAHSAGGGMDINVFPQKSSLNRGAFRRLERLAVANRGSLYFVRLIYRDSSDRPSQIEQGAIVADSGNPRFEVMLFDN